MTVLTQKNKLSPHLASFFWKTIDWLYPPQCCNCARGGFILCKDCFAQIELITGKICKKCGYPLLTKNSLCENCLTSLPPYTEMRSWAKFSGPVRKALHTLKYQQNLAVGYLFAKPLADMVRAEGWSVDLVIPIPLSRSHHRTRGYNQAAMISRNLARQLGIQHLDDAVKRIKETDTQISLDVNKRFTNLIDAFYANPAKLKERKVLLVDDVITTGATMQHCTIALQNAGTAQVYCLSVARTMRIHPKFP